MTLPCTPGYTAKGMTAAKRGAAIQAKIKLGFAAAETKRFFIPSSSAYAKHIGASVAVLCKRVVILA